MYVCMYACIHIYVYTYTHQNKHSCKDTAHVTSDTRPTACIVCYDIRPRIDTHRLTAAVCSMLQTSANTYDTRFNIAYVLRHGVVALQMRNGVILLHHMGYEHLSWYAAFEPQ